MKYRILLIFSILFSIVSCNAQNESSTSTVPLKTGAERTTEYLPLLLGKKVGVVANATSIIDSTHLVDSLLNSGVQVTKVFAPEHGFRGDHGAGDKVSDSKDVKTGLPLISLYGSNKKPSNEMLKGLDVVIFDIQDVGARFYTYISTMHYVMEACAENKIPVIILDRPNPNGFYIDGPVLHSKFKSFVGMHPIPVVHGCTVGELAMMINGEGWLQNGLKCDLKVIPCEGYDHNTLYTLPVAPSPNLPNASSIYNYPSLCFFEGTIVSVGRGTELPFQIFGFPDDQSGVFEFTPKDIEGVVTNPPFEGQMCKGHNVQAFGEFYFPVNKQLYLIWLLDEYKSNPQIKDFFSRPEFFDKLMGTDMVRKQIEEGQSEEEIRKSWQSGLDSYKSMRKRYLLYKDFE
ncbi:MAG: DUF1343 domain-containing protein [Flavobacteriales bacterium]